MLAVAIDNLSFTHSLKCCCYGPILGLHILQCYTCYFDISRAISCVNGFLTPANLGMMPQITGRLCVSGI
jgi:hypothetical protein